MPLPRPMPPPPLDLMFICAQVPLRRAWREQNAGAMCTNLEELKVSKRGKRGYRARSARWAHSQFFLESTNSQARQGQGKKSDLFGRVHKTPEDELIPRDHHSTSTKYEINDWRFAVSDAIWCSVSAMTEVLRHRTSSDKTIF